MAVKCALYDEGNNIIDYADLSFMGAGVTFLIPSHKETYKQVKVGSRIVFQVENKYSQIYDANITEIAYDKIHLDDIRNLAPILHQDVRVDVDRHSTIYFQKDGQNYKVQVYIKDISSGGMCFVTRENLDRDITYEILVDWTETPILLKFKILRKEDLNLNRISYGCAFQDLHRTEESMLRASVYKLQAIQYKQKRMDENNAI